MIRRWKDMVPADHACHVSLALDERRMPIAYHGHDFAEICWVEEGEGWHRVNGRRNVLRAGQLVFIRPGDFHGLQTGESGRFRMQNVAFARSHLTRWHRLYLKGATRCFWATSKAPETLALDATAMSALGHEVKRLEASARDLAALDAFFLNLLHLLGGERLPSRPLPDWLDHALRTFAIPGDLAEGFPALCRRAGRCPEHLARTMRSHLDQSPTDWITHRRIDYAARLLETTQESVTEIAAASGFENLSHFHRLFRQLRGTTPRRHRQLIRAVM